MRFRRKHDPILEGDLTPMIDMTFQLIAFFMLIINFSKVEKSEEIQLPLSDLAKPPEEPPPYKIVLNLEEDGSVKHAGQTINRIELLNPILKREIDIALRENIPTSDIHVIIRADKNVKTGLVQELMAKCQENDLETFALRVNERLR